MELIIVVSLAGILTGIVAPSLRGLGADWVARSIAESVASHIAAVRAEAVANGRATILQRDPDGKGLQAAIVAQGASLTFSTGATTATAAGPTITSVTVTQLPRLTFRVPRSPTVTFGTPTGSDDELVFRPSGYVRGDNVYSFSTPSADVTNDTWRLPMVVAHNAFPNGTKTWEIIVNPVGLICVQQGTGLSCP